MNKVSNQKYIFIVDYWVPFPSSEYGGVQCYIASTENEVIDMIIENCAEYEMEHYPNYYDRIRDCVESCPRYKLSDSEQVDCELVYSFIT